MLKGIRNPACELCKLHRTADVVCQIGFGPPTATVMVVSKMSNSMDYQSEIESQLAGMGLDIEDVYWTQALKCRTFDQDASNADVKQCKTYLEAEIAQVKPKFILAMGNEALLATVGKSGITKYRGRVFERTDGVEVIATISPSAVKRNPGQTPGYHADLRLFVNKVKGRASGIEPPKYLVVNTLDDLKKVKKVLAHTEEIDFDVETLNEYYEADGRLVSFAATCEVRDRDSKLKTFVFAIPLYHPESPWQHKGRAVMRALKPLLEAIPRVVAHNSSFDCKWMHSYGVKMYPTFDTLLAIHVLDENVQKGLKPQAMARLGVEPWGIDTGNLLAYPIEDVLHYNVLDTWYMYHVKKQLVQELKEDRRAARLLVKEVIPAQRDLIDSELRGIWIDVNRLKDRAPKAQTKLEEVEAEIRKAAKLPAKDSPEWPKDAKGKPREENFNASIFARWMLFEWCELPVLKRGKQKANGSPGDPSMAEDVLLHLRDHHPVVNKMLDRVEWQKAISSFFNPYQELYDDEHRIHTNFKLHGTVTGRLSSGKADADKITGSRGKRKGVNLQQVPRDPFIRGLFGAPPGWTFVEADYSQIELRIAAFLAKEDTMKHLYAIGADIHTITAARITGLPESQVPKKVRKEVGKPVNFGFLYGMSWRKFIETAFNNYGAVFSEEEARAARQTYFDLYPKLLPWHNRQRRLVHEYGRVQSPMGRVRNLPDIYSPDQGVMAEAERQAINSPVQGFASDLAVLSMIAINEKFRKLGIQGHCLGLVHDAINFEIRDDYLAQALPVIKDTMEDMSIVRKKFGVHVDIPIISDIQVGQHWGDSKELTPEMVYDFKLEYKGE